MTFQPIIPSSGYTGWAFLNRTLESQKEAFNASPELQRDTEYFEENIGSVKTVEDLMSNRRLLSVALGAFGLNEDIDSQYFIQKVLSDGTISADSLANKLSDKRYAEFSAAFGFGDLGTPNTALSTFPQTIISRYQDSQFEIAVGNQDESMRLALNLDRQLTEIAEKSGSDAGRWYGVMGNTAVRTVFETALGLPSALGKLDLDQQMTEFRGKTEQYFDDSEVAQFSDPNKREELVRLYLVRNEIAQSGLGTSSAQNALLLLSN